MRHWEITGGTLPWTRSCFVCGQDNPHGLRLRSCVEGDRVVLTHTTREADLGWRHLVHGGIAMTLLDEVMTWAAMLAFRQAAVAAEVTVRLKRPMVAGHAIRVEGWISKATSRLVLSSGTIVDEQGALLVEATGKYAPMPAGGLHMCKEDFVESPDALALPFLTGGSAL